MRNSITVVVVALAVVLAFAGDADAKRKKRKKRKKAKQPVAEQVLEPAATPEATPPAPPAESEATPPMTTDAGAIDAAAAAVVAEPVAEPAASESAAAPTPKTAVTEPATASSSSAVAEEITASEIGTAAASTAAATREETPATEEAPPSFALFAGVGGGFSQVVSKLGAGLRANIQGGYMLPFLGHRLQLYVGVGYAQAGRTASGDDARLEGGSYSFDLVERELIVGGGVAARIWPPGTWFNVVLRAGADARMQKTEVEGDAGGAAFGANQETATAVGAVFGSGVELMLGPGAVVGELGFSFADLSHTITGDASTGGIWIRAGYRLFF